MNPLRGLLIMILSFGMFACSRPSAAGELPKPEQDLPAPTEEGEMRAAVLAGGCFWCVEAVFKQLEGVTEVVSGYAGDTKENAVYEKVAAGKTRHAEAVHITYDPSKVSYGELLRVFFATHDPTTEDRQGPDWGPQYRSAVFYADEEQKRVTEAYIRQLEEAKVFDDPIVTTLEPLEEFFPAEKYHQNFAEENPQNPYIRRWAAPKVEKVREQFAEQVKEKE